jgi:hypothetical protein
MEKPIQNIPSESKINDDAKIKLRELEAEIPKNEQETMVLLNQIDPNVLAKLPVGKKFIRDQIVKIIDAYSDKVTTKEQLKIISKLDDVRIALNEAIPRTGFTGLKNSMARTYNRMTGRGRGNKRTRKRKGGLETPRESPILLQPAAFFPEDDNDNENLPVAEGVQQIPMAEPATEFPEMETLSHVNALTNSEKMRYREAHPTQGDLEDILPQMEDRIKKIPCSASRPDLCVLKLILDLTLKLVFIPLGIILMISALGTIGVVGVSLRVALPFLLPIRLLILVLMRLFNLSTTEYFAFDRAFATPDSMMQAWASRPGETAERIEMLEPLYAVQDDRNNVFSDSNYRRVNLAAGPKGTQQRYLIMDDRGYEVPTAAVLDFGIPAPSAPASSARAGGGKMKKRTGKIKKNRKQKSKSKKYRSRK